MKKLLLFSVLVLMLTGCGGDGGGHYIPPSDNGETEGWTGPWMFETGPDLIFKLRVHEEFARSTEATDPGWIEDFYNNHADLMTEYGIALEDIVETYNLEHEWPDSPGVINFELVECGGMTGNCGEAVPECPEDGDLISLRVVPIGGVIGDCQRILTVLAYFPADGPYAGWWYFISGEGQCDEPLEFVEYYPGWHLTWNILPGGLQDPPCEGSLSRFE